MAGFRCAEIRVKAYSGIPHYNEVNRAAWHTINIQTDRINTLIDPGANPTYIPVAENFDSVLVSHAHMDHIGGMMDVIDGVRQIPVYMTNGTMMEWFKQIKLIGGLGKDSEKFVMYSHVRDFGISFKPSYIEDGLATFYPVKHRNHGASSILLKGSKANIFYTGDYADMPELPNDRIDLLITEGKRIGKDPRDYVDSNHAFESTILELIGKLNPTYIMLIHGRYSSLKCFQNRFHDLNILVPKENEEIIVGGE